MTVFSVLLALVLERLRITPDNWQLTSAYRWWLNYSARQARRQHTVDRKLVYLGLVLLPAVVLGGVFGILQNTLLMLFLNVVVLTLTLGCRQERQLVRQYLLAAQRGDQDAWQAAAEGLARSGLPGLTTGQQLVWLNYRYYFAVVFWFVLLGAPGALGYAILRYREATFSWVLNWLDWVPLRLAGFGYLLVGHFSRALPKWLKCFMAHPDEGAHPLLAVAQAAEDVPLSTSDPAQEPAALLSLARRTMIFWLAAIALATLVGVLS